MSSNRLCCSKEQFDMRSKLLAMWKLKLKNLFNGHKYSNLSHKIAMLRGLLTGEKAYVGPFCVNIDLTNRCNLQCLYCRWHSPLLKKSTSSDQISTDFSFELFKILCEDLSRMGTSLITFIGTGEPLLHPRAFEFISFAKEKRFEVKLFTNGTLLDESRIKTLIDLRLDTLSVSLWAGSPEEYKQHHPGSNAENWSQIIAGLQLLAKLKTERGTTFPLVELYHPITHFNVDTMDKIVDLTRTTNSNKLSFVLASNTGWEDEKFSPLFLKSNQKKLVRSSLTRIRKQLKSFSVQHNVRWSFLRYRFDESAWRGLPCYIAWNYAYIKSDGTVLPCQRCNISMGNLHDQSFYKTWNNAAYRAFRRTTLTREGIDSMAERCDCRYCCQIETNSRIHSIFRWVSPLQKKFRKTHDLL